MYIHTHIPLFIHIDTSLRKASSEGSQQDAQPLAGSLILSPLTWPTLLTWEVMRDRPGQRGHSLKPQYSAAPMITNLSSAIRRRGSRRAGRSGPDG